MAVKDKMPGVHDRHICRIYYKARPGMVKIGTCLADMVREDKGLWLTEDELSALCKGMNRE